MKWLQRLLVSKPEQKHNSPPILTRQQTPDENALKLNRDLPSLNFPMQALALRLEVLVVLIQRWPYTDADLKNWDKLADKAKKDRTNPISAGFELGVPFNSGFWLLSLSNTLWNLELAPSEYLCQQAQLFRMDDSERWVEAEAELFCRIAVALKRIDEEKKNKYLNIDECMDFLELCKLLPDSEHESIYNILAFVVNGSLGCEEFVLHKSDDNFWTEVVDTIDKAVRLAPSPLKLQSVDRLRQVLAVRGTGEELPTIIFFNSNSDQTQKLK